MSNSVLQLETLNKEYDLTLKKYNKARRDLMALYKKSADSQPQPKTAQECTDMGGGNSFQTCSATGLTYCCGGVCNGTQSCSSNGGLEGCACTNKYQQDEENLLKRSKKLNDQLTQQLNQITMLEQQSSQDLKNSIIKSHMQEKMLDKTIKVLNVEKDKIKQLMGTMDELESSQNEGDIIVTSNYYGYIIFLIITIISILGVMLIGKLMKSDNGQKGGRFFNMKRK